MSAFKVTYGFIHNEGDLEIQYFSDIKTANEFADKIQLEYEIVEISAHPFDEAIYHA